MEVGLTPFTFLLEALFPQYCVRCHEEGSLFCARCQAAWAPRPINHDGIFSLGSYKDEVLQTLIGLWKFDYVDHAGVALMRIVDLAVRDYHGALSPIDAVTFIPLHPRKRNLRGFDQAEVIAERVAAILDRPCLSLLSRTRYTRQQSQVDREKRTIHEFDGAFRVEGLVPQRLLLVDDVATTGSTMGAARAALLLAGATDVRGFTLARG